MAAVAMASSLTLSVADNAPVTNAAGATSHENIAVTSSGFAVYTLTGDSASHPECTKANGCFHFWPPVTVAAGAQLPKSASIRGTLAKLHRDGIVQLTLNGHPLYRFLNDTHPRAAKGQGITGFGGTWHVVSAGSESASTGATGSGSPAGTTTTTTTQAGTTTTTTTTQAGTTTTTTTTQADTPSAIQSSTTSTTSTTSATLSSTVPPITTTSTDESSSSQTPTYSY